MSAEFGFGWKENSCLVTHTATQIKSRMKWTFLLKYILEFMAQGPVSTNKVLWIIKKKTLEKETFWYLAAFSCLIGYSKRICCGVASEGKWSALHNSTVYTVDIAVAALLIFHMYPIQYKAVSEFDFDYGGSSRSMQYSKSMHIWKAFSFVRQYAKSYEKCIQT